MILSSIWFMLIAVLFAGYAILDGFDLGVGVLHLFRRKESDRRRFIGAIGPVWDGNEVWLLTGGGALFAAFPIAYATVFSSFYLALMLLLLALILRAICLEFRRQIDSNLWRHLCDLGFGVGSLLTALLLGVALGNILRGIPLDENGTFTGNFLGLLNPYAILVGLLSLTGLTLHGAVYLTTKTDGDLQNWLGTAALRLWIAVGILLIGFVGATFLVAPYLFQNVLAIIPLIALAVSFLALRMVLAKRNNPVTAFCLSAITVASTVALVATALFPRLVPSSTDLAYSLTAQNASSTPKTLGVMLIVALLGIPVMLAYTAYAYWIFRKPDDGHY